jgi:thiamine pyrophosphokinase
VRAVVVTGGKAPSASIVARWAGSADIVVAADSGLATAIHSGVHPDLVVGDFDSLENDELLSGMASSQIQRYPRDKDETDTEIAIRVCRERGADEVVIVGGGGGQMGHFVGILSLFDRPVAPAVWVTDTAEFTCITSSVAIDGRVGEVIGFFPAGCDTCEMWSTGLRWPLDAIVWHKGDTGVSNELCESRAEIGMKRGRLLMIRDLEGWIWP